MDDPVTDVKFVSDVAHCPEGYKLVSTCPCGHDAQLWEKVLGGVDATRYLCFTKDNDAEEVLEDMYVPSAGTRYLYKGFEVVGKTVEGETALRHKQLAVKKVPRKTATKVVADVIVCRSRDKISKLYKQSEKVNGLRICHRTANYKYIPPKTASMTHSEHLEQRLEALSVYEQKPSRLRSSTDFREASKTKTQTNKDDKPRSTSLSNEAIESYVPKLKDPPPSSPIRSSDGSGHSIDLYNYDPSPKLSRNKKPVVEEAVQVATVQSLGSAPPPSEPATTPPPPQVEPGPSSVPPVTVQSDVQQPSYPSTNPFSQSQPSTASSLTTHTTAAPSSYQQQSYQAPSNPTNTYPQQYYPGHAPGSYPYNPMQSTPAAHHQPAQGYPPSNPFQNPSMGYGFSGGPPGGGYPPQQPHIGGYDYASIAGSSYAQASYGPPQGGSHANVGPYNPYHQQSTYPPALYPPQARHPSTGAANTNTPSYGFKF